ncbi:threonylcarbamoyladenosine tRNA methylthiotransferase-like [Sinocyclocheilus grahami]|uniref:threonylcarbamoyladenosine tRNA methylthiotransferase-like n=1 Tax=Sinocyclocheilus grahami TaxID=75366 RepID=UPI0007AD47EE|nr:PREDICTED: threonylcarbamoyladenosine tRNA methylthiotransferase-like [Sinocyclocheilus grahami]
MTVALRAERLGAGIKGALGDPGLPGPTGIRGGFGERAEKLKAQEQNKKVVVAGCVPQAQPRTEYLRELSIIGVQQIDRVVEVVDEAIKGHSVRLLGQKKEKGKRLGGARLDLPKIRKNPLIEIISINTGCLNACTYCKTKHARGDLASYPIEELVERARQSFQEGICEIWLTSEDTGAYGRDIGTDLPSLLWELVKEIPEGAMLRLGMTNPPYILEHLEEVSSVEHKSRCFTVTAAHRAPVRAHKLPDTLLISLAQKRLCNAGTDLMVRDAHSDDDCWTFTGPIKSFARENLMFSDLFESLLVLRDVFEAGPENLLPLRKELSDSLLLFRWCLRAAGTDLQRITASPFPQADLSLVLAVFAQRGSGSSRWCSSRASSLSPAPPALHLQD